MFIWTSWAFDWIGQVLGEILEAGADWTVGKSVIYRIKFTKKKILKNEKINEKKKKKKERKKINKRKNIKKENS